MKERNPDVHSLHAAHNPLVEIPPQQHRKHITEPSWIENMIYFTGLYLEREARLKDETEEPEEEDPPKTEAA